MQEVFDALGIRLLEMDDWNCCGGAAAHSLNKVLGLTLPARNIARAQAGGLPLAVPCPACFNNIKKAQYVLSKDTGMREKLEDIVGFTYKGNLEIKTTHEVILEQLGLTELKRNVKKPLSGLRVVSYYGCLLVRSPEIVQMGSHENPTFLDDIIRTLGGEPLDWSYKTDCCGADLGMTHGSIATDIADRITGMAVEADAHLIMTGCGLCQINLDMRQSCRAHDGIPILYMTELMGIAMDLPGRNRWWSRHIIDPKPILGPLDLL